MGTKRTAERQKPPPRAEANGETRPSPYQVAIQRMVHFSEYSEIFLPEDGPKELGANISIADAEWVEQEARRTDSQSG